jgi:hypothetical protein
MLRLQSARTQHLERLSRDLLSLQKELQADGAAGGPSLGVCRCLRPWQPSSTAPATFFSYPQRALEMLQVTGGRRAAALAPASAAANADTAKLARELALERDARVAAEGRALTCADEAAAAVSFMP